MELDDLKKSWNALDEHLKKQGVHRRKRDSTTAGTCP